MQVEHRSFLLSGESLQDIIHEIGVDRIMDELIERTFNSFVDFDKNNTVIPVRTGFNYTSPKEGLIEWMPIRNISQREVLLKVVGYHPQNPESYQLPTVISTLSKYDTTTGHLEAILDGVLPTSLRTGAISAIASKLFGNPASKVLGLIGCGAQAVTQLHALSRVFNFEKVIYFDTNAVVLNSFKERTSMLDLDIIYQSSTIEEIIQTSDIVSTATSIAVNEGPLFEYKASKPWLHINAVGSDFPGKIELPKVLLDKSYVSPDFLEQAVIEGECQQLTEKQIGDDIINCLQNANNIKHLKDELTVFDSTGMALQDQIVADMFISLAKKLEKGEYISLENLDNEAQNPYSFLTQIKKVEN